ncbi:MAG: TetR/AcrR family transcriptional regulator [Planctomycetota bacterium]
MPPRSSPRAARLALDPARIAAAAVELADHEGLAALSMRRLARLLGVEAMSLYHHVANKEELLDGMVDRVVAEIEPPELGQPWRGALRRRAHSAHDMLRRHPWAAQLIVARVNVGPAMLRYIDATIGCLREAGFTLEQADRAWNAIDSHVYGFTLQEANFPLEPDQYVEAATAFSPQIPPDRYPHLHAMARLVIDGQHHGIQDFDFGLELILDGLQRLLEPGRASR